MKILMRTKKTDKVYDMSNLKAAIEKKKLNFEYQKDVVMSGNESEKSSDRSKKNVRLVDEYHASQEDNDVDLE